MGSTLDRMKSKVPSLEKLEPHDREKPPALRESRVRYLPGELQGGPVDLLVSQCETREFSLATHSLGSLCYKAEMINRLLFLFLLCGSFSFADVVVIDRAYKRYRVAYSKDGKTVTVMSCLVVSKEVPARECIGKKIAQLTIDGVEKALLPAVREDEPLHGVSLEIEVLVEGIRNGDALDPIAAKMRLAELMALQKKLIFVARVQESLLSKEFVEFDEQSEAEILLDVLDIPTNHPNLTAIGNWSELDSAKVSLARGLRVTHSHPDKTDATLDVDFVTADKNIHCGVTIDITIKTNAQEILRNISTVYLVYHFSQVVKFDTSTQTYLSLKGGGHAIHGFCSKEDRALTFAELGSVFANIRAKD